MLAFYIRFVFLSHCGICSKHVTVLFVNFSLTIVVVGCILVIFLVSEIKKIKEFYSFYKLIHFPILVNAYAIINQIIKVDFFYFFIFLFFSYFLLCLTSSKVSKKLTKIQDVRIYFIVLYYFVS